MKVEKGSDEIIEDKNCCHKQTHRTKEEKKIVNDRLNRIEGQIKEIKKMIDEDRYCNDVLIQLSAVENSIRSLSICGITVPLCRPGNGRSSTTMTSRSTRSRAR